MKFDNKFAMSCDWAQIHVKAPENFLEIENPFYRYERTGQSRTWKNIYAIYNTAMNVKVAEYCTDANEYIMKRHHGVLKFENNQLYINEDLKGFIEGFLKKMHFRFEGVTRFDVAMDFQKFANNYDPQFFIKNYMHCKIARLNGNRKKFSIMGEQNERFHKYQTLYFGSRKSDVQVKMYNKTEELKENKKPWIEGIHKNTFDKESGDVWRIEFSIYSMKALLSREGVTLNYNSLEIFDLHKIYGIFMGLFEKHFSFKHTSRQKRMTRRKDVKLWHFDLDILKLKMQKQSPLKKSSGRAEKIFLNRLKKFVDANSLDEDLNVAVRDLAGRFVNIYNLEDHANKICLDYAGYENYVFHVEEFLQLKANEEKLICDFNNAMRIQALIEDTGWIKTV